MAGRLALSTILLSGLFAFASVPAVRAEPPIAGDTAKIQLAQRSSDVYVNGYQRRDGTYVQPHMRSAPDRDPSNNYSYPGNLNPYTGKVAPGNSGTHWGNHGSGSTGSRGFDDLDN